MRFSRPNPEVLKQQLVRNFREWESSEARRLNNLYRGLHAALPLVTDPVKSTAVRREAENLERTIDILNGRDDAAKFALYKEGGHV